MAEGGGEDKDNPFSFKNFIQKKDKTKKANTDSRRDINDDSEVPLPDISNTSQNRASPNSDVLDGHFEPSGSKQKKKSGDGNPFSFKKFLESSTGSARSQRPRSHKNASLSQKTPDLATDLPDFVQDHYSDNNIAIARPADAGLPDFCFSNDILSSSPHSRERTSSGNHLPDFTLESSHADSRRKTKDSQRDSTDTNLTNSIETNKVLDTDSDHVTVPPRSSRNKRSRAEKKSNVPTGLPDFLSDSVFSGAEQYSDNEFVPASLQEETISSSSTHAVSNSRNSVTVFEVNGDLELECRKLREENQQLRLQLEEAKQEAVSETQRCHKMKKEMETIQKKEAEETSALERMMQQVEANLITTTQRAVLAENNVSRLQGEVKSLQSQLGRVRAENEMLRSGDVGMSDMKERTNYAAQQLSSAAATAEKNLRDLLSGVENLKIVAQVLDSIDKITVPKEDEDTNRETGAKKEQNSNKDKNSGTEQSKKEDDT